MISILLLLITLRKYGNEPALENNMKNLLSSTGRG